MRLRGRCQAVMNRVCCGQSGAFEAEFGKLRLMKSAVTSTFRPLSSSVAVTRRFTKAAHPDDRGALVTNQILSLGAEERNLPLVPLLLMLLPLEVSKRSACRYMRLTSD